ncbi:MAG: YihY family inner membrane protein [Pedosphaera sp.]|nr:YihY family inner membrane protein [Pedosphaera sp.]
MPKPSIGKFRKLHAEAQAFLGEQGTELHDDTTFSHTRRFLHFWVLVGKSFARNRCPVRAAALAYTTLLALVPVLAVVVSVSTGFLKKEEGQKQIQHWIDFTIAKIAPELDLVSTATNEAQKVQIDSKAIAPETSRGTIATNELRTIHTDAGAVAPAPGGGEAISEDQKASGRRELVSKINGFIHNFQSGTLGVTAILALVFVAISLLSTIEATLNDMWGVTRGRAWFSRSVQYWAVISLGPLFLVLAAGFSSWNHFKYVQSLIEKVPLLGVLVFSHVAPFIILSLACALFYLLMPNTKVDWRAALIGGTVAGALLHLNSNLNFLYVSRVVTYKQVYGSLAIIPLFLVGLYFSWIVLLFGAQTAYAFQNRRAYIQEKQAERINQKGREFIALRLMTLIGHRFQAADHPPSSSGISEEIGVPLRLASQILSVLVETKLLIEVAGTETGYAPARPLESISAQDILQAVRAGQGHELATCDDSARALVRGAFESIQQAEQHVAAGLSLQSLVEASRAAQASENPSEALA